MENIELNVNGYWMNNEKGIDESIYDIVKKYNFIKDYNQKLISENIELKDEHYKDFELKKLQEKNKELRDSLLRGFAITPKEHKSILKWQEEHNCTSTYSGISEYRFDIIPGIGYNGYVKCSCGKEFCFYRE